MRFALPLLKKYFLIIAFIFCANNLFAQNYFANADFEQLNNCTEYHQDCSPAAWFYLKPAITPLINNYEVPKPFSGKDLLILQVENVFIKIKKRSFIYTMFCCPLQAGKNYKLSFYINSKSGKMKGIDFYFSSKEFISANFNADSLQPTIHIDSSVVLNAYGSWKYVETIYKATGNEKYCYIGNLSKSAYNFSVADRMNKAGDVFYFIDDISFTPVIAEKLCKQYNTNLDKLLAQTLRHTEAVLVNKETALISDTIILPSVYFENDKAIIKPAFRKILNALLEKVKQKNINSVSIEGHTDNNGSDEHNVILSEQRANAVKDFLETNLPSLKNNIEVVGKAASNPIADNKTKEGRAKNRRVQVIFTYNAVN